MRKSYRKCGKMGRKLTKSLPFRDNCYHFLCISFVERKQHYIFHAKTILHILLFPSSKRRDFVSLKQRSQNEACLERPGGHTQASPPVSRSAGCWDAPISLGTGGFPAVFPGVTQKEVNDSKEELSPQGKFNLVTFFSICPFLLSRRLPSFNLHQAVLFSSKTM